MQDTLLRLYRLAREADVDTFQSKALALISDRLKFDSAFWGTGRYLPGCRSVVAQEVCLHELNPAFLTSWSEMNGQDRAVGLLYNNPGRAFSLDVPEFFRDTPDYAAVGEQFDIRTISAVTTTNEGIGKISWLCLYSKSAEKLLDCDGLAQLELFMPHLKEASLINCLLNSRLVDRAATLAGIANRITGFIIKGEPGFLEGLSRWWPTFDGRLLPNQVRVMCNSGSRFHLDGRHGQLRGAPFNDLVLLTFAPVIDKPGITSRQLEIAIEFSAGTPYKRIAATLGISPTTVRNHLAAVYSALNVHSREQLKVVLATPPF